MPFAAVRAPRQGQGAGGRRSLACNKQRRSHTNATPAYRRETHISGNAEAKRPRPDQYGQQSMFRDSGNQRRAFRHDNDLPRDIFPNALRGRNVGPESEYCKAVGDEPNSNRQPGRGDQDPASDLQCVTCEDSPVHEQADTAQYGQSDRQTRSSLRRYEAER
ncbi:hypothetical protein Lfu02_77820 [Longispora fulva]|nr:hypothetical protein Lfu02_77820 [Longispora fulva]